MKPLTITERSKVGRLIKEAIEAGDGGDILAYSDALESLGDALEHLARRNGWRVRK